jgi:hypothetical protein
MASFDSQTGLRPATALLATILRSLGAFRSTDQVLVAVRGRELVPSF